MQIEYRFVNETVAVEVDDAWGALLQELNRHEYNNHQTETRRHASLDAMEYEGDAFLDETADAHAIAEQVLVLQSLRRALLSLLPQQRALIWQVYFEGRSLVDIAREEGVDHTAISHRLRTIYKNLKKLI